MKKWVTFWLISLVTLFLSFFADGFFQKLMPSLKNPYLDFIAKIFTSYAALFMVYIIIPAFIFALIKKKNLVPPLWLSLGLSFLLSFVIKFIIARPRMEYIEILPFNLIDYSFPSTHVAFVFAALPIITYASPKLKKPYFVFAIATGIFRIYQSAHYFSDVIAGTILGLSIGYIVLFMGKKHARN